MTEGLRTGEDVIQGATLWYSGARISYARSAPGYRVRTEPDAGRTSVVPKPAREALGFLDAVLAPDFVVSLSPRARESFAIKLLRTNVVDVLHAALEADDPRIELLAITDAIRRIDEVAPTAPRLLSRADGRLLALAVATSPDVEALRAALRGRGDFRRPSAVLPVSLTRLLHREAPPRFLLAYALSR